MNPADLSAQGYAESPGAFRNRWALSHFRFHRSSWVVLALMLLALGWIAGRFGGLHLAVKGVLAAMALVAVAPLVRDFTRPHCRRCDEEADQQRDVTACHHCRVFKVASADSSLLPL